MPDSNVVPLYQQIKEDIKAAIERGKYKPNEKIPAEPELSAEYSVSRITVRRAVEGAVQRRVSGQDAGPGDLRQHAADPPQDDRRQQDGELFQDLPGVRDGPRGHGCWTGKSCRSGKTKKPSLAAARMICCCISSGCGRPTGARSLRKNLFFPYQEFKSLMQMEWNDTSAFEIIRGLTGRWPVDTAHRTIEVTRASAEQAQELNVPLGDPLLFLNAYFLDQNGKPLVIGRQYYVGSRYMFEL